MLEKIKKRVNDFSELVMFKHSIFALPFIFIAMVVASYIDIGSGWFGWKLFFIAIFEAVFARNFAMGINRYLDRDIDKINPRTKNRPSVDGRISEFSMLSFIIINGGFFILVSYFVNNLAFYLSIPILIVLGGYSLFKRFSSLAHIVLGISLGLAPIAGVIAVLGEVPLWSLYLSFGVIFWVAGFDLLYSIQDIEFDKEQGLHSIPSKFGLKNTLYIARVFHILTILFWSLFTIEANLDIFAIMALIMSAIMLGVEHYIVSKSFRNIDKAFFKVNGLLGIFYFMFIILEVI